MLISFVCSLFSHVSAAAGLSPCPSLLVHVVCSCSCCLFMYVFRVYYFWSLFVLFTYVISCIAIFCLRPGSLHVPVCLYTSCTGFTIISAAYVSQNHKTSRTYIYVYMYIYIYIYMYIHIERERERSLFYNLAYHIFSRAADAWRTASASTQLPA